MQRAMDLVASIRDGFFSEEKQHFLFRELAEMLLDPKGPAELAVCDNEGNVLGYFEPVARRMKAEGHSAATVTEAREFLNDSKPAKEVFGQLIDRTRPRVVRINGCIWFANTGPFHEDPPRQPARFLCGGQYGH